MEKLSFSEFLKAGLRRRCAQKKSLEVYSTTYQTIRLPGAGASAGAKQVAALSGFGSEAPSLVALWAAVDLAELLAVVRTLAPAPGLARLVAGRAVSLLLGEPVDVQVLGRRTGDDLVPLDRLDVAQVVVVQDTHAAFQYIWKVMVK